MTIERGDVYVIHETESGVLTGFIVAVSPVAFLALSAQRGQLPPGPGLADWLKSVRGIEVPVHWKIAGMPALGIVVGTEVPLPAGYSPEELQSAWNRLTASIEEVIEKPLYLSTIVDGKVILYSDMENADD